MKTLTLILYFFLALIPRLSGAQPFYHLNTESLDEAGIQAAQVLLNKAEALLPEKLKTQFPKGIEVEFTLKGQAHGKALIRSLRSVRTKAPRLALNKKIMGILIQGELNSPPSLDDQGHLRAHKTAYREALASVLHETAHLYDYLDIQTPQMKDRIGFCQFIPQDDQMLEKECAIYKNIRTTLSTNPYYLEVAGWVMLANGSGDRTSDNMFRFRSPDPYEFKNPQEHFAVNFEYFLLDPNFACRRPALANLFAGHFGVSLPVCAVNYKYVDPDATDVDPQTKQIRNLFKEIPLERIYQVHYLLAEPGSSFMSRFGHSMLRLVICAPGQPKGPECLTKGLPYNLVLSFRAFINTPQINSIAGLTGKYPSRLFVVPLENVIQEYNEVEYRGLKSYPLKLSPAEMKSLVERALETHWSYDSQYYFISNNCAVETLNLLRASLLRPELIDKRVIYPKDLLRVLLREKIASPVPQDPIKALEQGYYFDSSEVKHLQSYNLFFDKKAGSAELKEFLSLPVEKRRELYFQRFSELKRPLQYKDLVSPFQLEHYLLVLKKSDFRSEVTTQIWMNKAGGALSSLKDLDLNEIYKKAIEAFGSLSAPHQILKLTDYGIPSENEIKDSMQGISMVRTRIEDARKVESEVKKNLEKNSTYQESLKIKELINDILNME